MFYTAVLSLILIKTWLKNFTSKLDHIFRNDKVAFFGFMCLAILLIIFKGASTSEGQASVFSKFLTGYIEETAASVTTNIPQHQLADINSVFAFSNGSSRAPQPSVLSIIQDNSLVSRATILTNILDEFSDRGSEIQEYEVQEGDTLSFIASDYGVSVTTIVNANNLRSPDDIKPGIKLKIPPVDGVIHRVKKGDTVESIAKKYGAEAGKIISFNSLPKAGELQIDDELIVPGGKLQGSSAIAGASIAKRFAYLPNLGDFFSMPTVGFNWGRLHGRNGVDIANSCGTGIFASAEGTITLAKNSGWNGGFGKYIKIIHPNGTETLYSHLSKILISAGEYVGRGQQIGLMGSTGRSTGCHLHFEVHGAKNPLAKY
ncbi:MAG: M23 family metallopeptidase [Patescibacteria group bacterium]